MIDPDTMARITEVTGIIDLSDDAAIVVAFVLTFEPETGCYPLLDEHGNERDPGHYFSSNRPVGGALDWFISNDDTGKPHGVVHRDRNAGEYVLWAGPQTMTAADVERRLENLRAWSGFTDVEVLLLARMDILPDDPEYAEWLVLLDQGGLVLLHRR